MADEESVSLLRRGSAAWNEQRKLGQANLSKPDLRWADLHEANLRGADLHEANLSWANLRGADLSGADLSGANLRWTNLSGMNLHEANLRRADLSGVDLIGANLRMAVLTMAHLHGANLRKAVLTMAHLHGANLRMADLGGANLRDADLSEAVLSGADVSQSIVGGTIFACMDLSTVHGLESVQHAGPSTIGIDTIYKSKGKIPGIFLRGAGVPEPLIVQMKALIDAMSPIQFYSCLICYSSKDQDFAERLHADLQGKGVRCWFAPEDLKIGGRVRESIEESIRVYDKVMIVLSDASVKSRWVEREVRTALEREERDARTVLFPIRIDEAVMAAPQPWAAEVRRTRHIGDFREWQHHAAYRTAFDRLLRDLQQASA